MKFEIDLDIYEPDLSKLRRISATNLTYKSSSKDKNVIPYDYYSKFGNTFQDQGFRFWTKENWKFSDNQRKSYSENLRPKNPYQF